jgi:hypothetical protein
MLVLSAGSRGGDDSKVRTMLGDLIANLDSPGVAVAVLQTLDPILAAQIEKRAAAEAMTPADFVTGAVRDFVERAAGRRASRQMRVTGYV